MAVIAYRYYRHDPSGELYAVRTGGDIIADQWTGICGPLHYSERTTPLDQLDYDQGDNLDWLIENNGSFRDVTRLEEHITIKS